MRLLFDFPRHGFIGLLAIRKTGLVRRRLHLGDYHSAQCERLLQRANVHSHQMSVSFDVFGAEFVELVGDLSRHDRRQRRRDRHKEDQAYGNAEYAF